MDIKDLNNAQMILLVLLVSFVVSIATGVSVVSLMQQEPTTVTQTINKVIERTIEKVSVPAENTDTKKDKTKEEKSGIVITDSTTSVNIYSKIKLDESSTEEPKRKLVGTGVVISDTGLLLVDASLVNTELNTYEAVLEKNYFSIKAVNKIGSIYIFQVTAKGEAYIPDETEIEDVPVIDAQ